VQETNLSPISLQFPLKASCARAMAESLFTLQNLQAKKKTECFSIEETDFQKCDLYRISIGYAQKSDLDF